MTELLAYSQLWPVSSNGTETYAKRSPINVRF